MGILQDARAVWKTLVVVITPLLLLPLVLPGSSQESRCGFVLGVMAVYWITESLPLAVTALLPVLLLPLLGIMASKQVCTIYFKDVIFLLLGGLMVAIAIEESNLHKRFALRLLLLLGVQPKRLMLGFMLATGFLSMWITNTATTAMMTPIARALLARLFKAQRRTRWREARRLTHDETHFSWPRNEKDGVEVATIQKRINVADIEVIIEPANGAPMSELTTLAKTRDTDELTKDTTAIQKQHPYGDKTVAVTADEIHDSNHKKTDHDDVNDVDDDDSDDDDDDNGDVDLDVSSLDEDSAKITKALCLSICYAANIGGVSTLTGTGPNLIFKNFVESMSGGKETVSFLTWMGFGMPVSAVILVLALLWLQLFYFGLKTTLLCRRQTSPAHDKVLHDYLVKEHRKLGHMTFAEKVVLLHFLALVALWITRSPGLFPGWSTLFEPGYVSDAIPAVLVPLSLFIFPREKPNIFCCRDVSKPSILQWTPMTKKFPWGVLLLLGGGFALAEAIRVSGLSELISQQLSIIGSLPSWAACLIVVVITSVVTEITSNTVITTLFLPIIAQVAATMNLHPVYFMLPSTVASSFAFMLPVATPPNAIVFAYGDVKVTDMIKAGFALNVIGILIVTVAINTFGYPYFNLDRIPDWTLMASATEATPLPNVTSLVTNYISLGTELFTNDTGI